MRSIRLLVAVGVSALTVGLAPGVAQGLSRSDAEQRFSAMVLESIGKKSAGGANCKPTRKDHFRCTGRWQRMVRGARGARIKLIVGARGSIFEDAEKIRSKAQLRKWKVVRGTRKGPFKGAFLMFTKYKPFD